MWANAQVYGGVHVVRQRLRTRWGEHATNRFLGMPSSWGQRQCKRSKTKQAMRIGTLFGEGQYSCEQMWLTTTAIWILGLAHVWIAVVHDVSHRCLGLLHKCASTIHIVSHNVGTPGWFKVVASNFINCHHISSSFITFHHNSKRFITIYHVRHHNSS